MLAETTVTTARAADLESTDVVKIDGTWRHLLEVYTCQADVESYYEADYIKADGPYPEMGKAYEAIGKRWDEDYVILRYVVQEKSTPAEVEDAVKVTDALDLMEVQVRTPKEKTHEMGRSLGDPEGVQGRVGVRSFPARSRQARQRLGLALPAVPAGDRPSTGRRK